MEHVDVDPVRHLQLEVHEVHLQEIHVLFILFWPVLLRLVHLGLPGSLTCIVNGAALFGPGCYDKTLFYEFLIEVDVEVLKDLLVIDEAQITMLRQVALADAVDGVNWAPLEFINVASNHLRSLLRVGQKQGDLIFVREFAEALKCAMSHFEHPVVRAPSTQLANDAIEVENDQVLVL